MQFKSKPIFAFLFLVLILFNPLHASGYKWKDIKGLEKFLLSEHKSDWNTYGGSKRKFLHTSAKKKAKKLRKYRKWIKKNLSPKQQKQLKKNFKKMSDKQFKKYMNGLFKKHGKPV